MREIFYEQTVCWNAGDCCLFPKSFSRHILSQTVLLPLFYTQMTVDFNLSRKTLKFLKMLWVLAFNKINILPSDHTDLHSPSYIPLHAKSNIRIVSIWMPIWSAWFLCRRKMFCCVFIFLHNKYIYSYETFWFGLTSARLLLEMHTGIFKYIPLFHFQSLGIRR